jgi:hypothetical protein
MTKTTAFALAAALMAMGATAPAFAQSYNPGDGTGNELPFAFGPGAVKQRSVAIPPAGLVAEPRQIAGSGGYDHLYAFAPTPVRRHRQ